MYICTYVDIKIMQIPQRPAGYMPLPSILFPQAHTTQPQTDIQYTRTASTLPGHNYSFRSQIYVHKMHLRFFIVTT